MNARPAIFQTLESTLSIDRGPPGFVGTIAIAVVDREVYWCIVEGSPARATISFANEAPKDRKLDAVLAIPAAELAKLADGNTPSPERCRVFGERALLQRFVERYLLKKSMLDVRSSKSGTAAPRRSAGRARSLRL